MSAELVTVLLIEDDDVDAEAVARGFDRGRITNPIRRARNGVEALRILRRESPDLEPITRPFVILLDLNMPRMSGIEFLATLRADPTIGDSVVFVLTTSAAERDRLAAKQHDVAGYIVKSQAGAEFTRLATKLDQLSVTVEIDS